MTAEFGCPQKEAEMIVFQPATHPFSMDAICLFQGGVPQKPLKQVVSGLLTLLELFFDSPAKWTATCESHGVLKKSVGCRVFSNTTDGYCFSWVPPPNWCKFWFIQTRNTDLGALVFQKSPVHFKSAYLLALSNPCLAEEDLRIWHEKWKILYHFFFRPLCWVQATGCKLQSCTGLTTNFELHQIKNHWNELQGLGIFHIDQTT